MAYEKKRGDGKGRSFKGKKRYIARKKVCVFCVDGAQDIDYKNVAKMSRYLSDRGKILSRRRTGVCAKHQRSLATALKRARHLALLPYTAPYVHRAGSAVPRQ
ncbi:MAG: 30S ribosomal protein S18 [Dehalococcoidia bacterium]|nr:30S ribosomal protein S18 [Dehalococcoidia bacterium]